LSYILRYGRLVRERYAGRLDGEADRYLRHIAESAGRLQTMIDDILAYSRISTRGEDFRPVDLGALADAAAAGLKGLFEETGTTYQRGPLPTLDVDAAQIEQLFQNLFSNAVKFRRADPPRIEVSARHDRGRWQVCVVDNGIGIASKDRERVFGMFQRLHGSDDYPGTGIGLAICRGIVERHGGKIWVESAPGQGSAFCFSLPGAAAPHQLRDTDSPRE